MNVHINLWFQDLLESTAVEIAAERFGVPVDQVDPDVWGPEVSGASWQFNHQPDSGAVVQANVDALLATGSGAAFVAALGCDRAAFAKMPKWKQDNKKKQLGLF